MVDGLAKRFDWNLIYEDPRYDFPSSKPFEMRRLRQEGLGTPIAGEPKHLRSFGINRLA